MAAGNRHLGYKEVLNEMERRSPGTKSSFYFGFVDRAVDRFADGAPQPGGEPAPAVLGRCTRCGAPAESELCAFCRLVERAGGAEPVPVAPPRRRS